MKKLSRLSAFFAFFLLGCLFFSTTASAYIDPSAMTYIVQIVVGIIIAGGAAFAFYFKKIKRKLRKKDKTEDDYDTREDIHVNDGDDEFDDSNLSDDDFDDYDEKK